MPKPNFRFTHFDLKEQRAGTVASGFDIERLAMPGLTELTD